MGNPIEYTFVLSGDVYHQKKKTFHKLLRKYQFKWKGKLPIFRWHSIGQSVIAEFDRVGDETKEAKITWMGMSETSFLDELKELFKHEVRDGSEEEKDEQGAW